VYFLNISLFLIICDNLLYYLECSLFLESERNWIWCSPWRQDAFVCVFQDPSTVRTSGASTRLSAATAKTIVATGPMSWTAPTSATTTWPAAATSSRAQIIPKSIPPWQTASGLLKDLRATTSFFRYAYSIPIVSHLLEMPRCFLWSPRYTKYFKLSLNTLSACKRISFFPGGFSNLKNLSTSKFQHEILVIQRNVIFFQIVSLYFSVHPRKTKK